MIDKIINLRIFETPEGKLDKSLLDTGGRPPPRIPVHPLRRLFKGPEALLLGRHGLSESPGILQSFRDKSAGKR